MWPPLADEGAEAGARGAGPGALPRSAAAVAGADSGALALVDAAAAVARGAALGARQRVDEERDVDGAGVGAGVVEHVQHLGVGQRVDRPRALVHEAVERDGAHGRALLRRRHPVAGVVRESTLSPQLIDTICKDIADQIFLKLLRKDFKDGAYYRTILAHMAQLHTATKMPRAYARKSNAIAVLGVHVGLDLKDKGADLLFLG